MPDDPAYTDAELAELANAIQIIARRLNLRSDPAVGLVSLTGTEAEVMRTIHRHPGLSATQVATRMGLQRSNVSAALRVLEAHDLVSKVRSAEDARAVELVATPKAVANLDRVRAGWADRLRLAGGDALTDAVAVREVLARLVERLDRAPEDGDAV